MFPKSCRDKISSLEESEYPCMLISLTLEVVALPLHTYVVVHMLKYTYELEHQTCLKQNLSPLCHLGNTHAYRTHQKFM